MQSLWKLTEAKCNNAAWIQCRIDPDDLNRLSSSYDIVLITCGADIKRLWRSQLSESTSLPSSQNDKKNNSNCSYNKGHIGAALDKLRLVRGQNVIYSFIPNNDKNDFICNLKTAILAGEYIIPFRSSGKLFCLLTTV